MLPGSHYSPIDLNDTVAKPQVLMLADAFTEFIAASARLESSYGELQQEVTHLGRELAKRNAALKESLAENERMHRALQEIVNSMPCGVIVVEGDDRISMINPEGRRLLDLGSLRAASLEAVSQAAGIGLSGFVKRQLGAEEEQEFCRVSAHGKQWLAVHDRRLSRGYEREGCQTILILRDVTVQKQAEFERERARKATALSEVATTLAHEIRNPLTSLELFAGLIAEGGEGASEWVSHLRAGIRSLAGIVNNVLSFHGVGFPAFAPLDLEESIRSSVEFVRPIADEAGVALEFVSTAAEVRIMGNGNALQQLVLNVVCNAVRHTSKGGCVTVSLERKVDALQQVASIEFADTGSGIAGEYLDEIFRPGFSGSGSTSGLGLAVCQQIVKQHDGTMRVTSTVGAGTTFYVEMPTL